MARKRKTSDMAHPAVNGEPLKGTSASRERAAKRTKLPASPDVALARSSSRLKAVAKTSLISPTDSKTSLHDKSVQSTSDMTDNESEFSDESTEQPTRGRRKSKTGTSKTPARVSGSVLVIEKGKPKAQTNLKKAGEVARGESLPAGDEDTLQAKTTRKRRVKVTEPVTYLIPDVEPKKTSFKGRLGYACLNTILRNMKPDPIFCSRTCRIATIKEKGMEYVYELGLQNIRDLKRMIQWNEENKISFMRMSSEMFPFASHAEYGYNLSFASGELKEAGDLAKKYGHRLTMHPGQFTQLGSPKPAVVTASIRELEYQCEIMDRMGLDQDSVMIIHMGGVYGDKEAALARFKDNYTNRLPEHVKARLVLENDEICYNLDDIMPVCGELNIPIVVDYHHDWIFPSSRPLAELIPLINATWNRKGIRVKQHLSEPRPGAVTPMEKRAHADRCQTLPDCLPNDMDLMIEASDMPESTSPVSLHFEKAKDKEQAVFELFRIYGLQDVSYENLRPPAKDQSLATGGRKSSSPRKKNMGIIESGAEAVILEGVEKEGEEVDAVD